MKRISNHHVEHWEAKAKNSFDSRVESNMIYGRMVLLVCMDMNDRAGRQFRRKRLHLLQTTKGEFGCDFVYWLYFKYVIKISDENTSYFITYANKCTVQLLARCLLVYLLINNHSWFENCGFMRFAYIYNLHAPIWEQWKQNNEVMVVKSRISWFSPFIPTLIKKCL